MGCILCSASQHRADVHRMRLRIKDLERRVDLLHQGVCNLYNAQIQTENSLRVYSPLVEATQDEWILLDE